MRVKLKICGMRNPNNILDVAMVQPDYMGFIFYSDSPRFVTNEFELPSGLKGSIKKVGVFVNQDVDQILIAINKYELDFVQLHGNEPITLCQQLQNENVGVIKAFSVDESFDFLATKAYSKVSDFFLFDTKGRYRGGNASVFDWSLLKRYDQEIPFFLSGGLSPENIGEVSKLKGMNLHAIDVNSGVETEPGVKNLERVKKLKLEIEKLRL